MITISLCMIAKNEEITLERCLNCAKDFVDEIIIVDTGSTDKAKEIAKNLQIKFMILNGYKILQQQEIFHLAKLPKNIYFT